MKITLGVVLIILGGVLPEEQIFASGCTQNIIPTLACATIPRVVCSTCGGTTTIARDPNPAAMSIVGSGPGTEKANPVEPQPPCYFTQACLTTLNPDEACKYDFWSGLYGCAPQIGAECEGSFGLGPNIPMPATGIVTSDTTACPEE
jgi:hypothetical protein